MLTQDSMLVDIDDLTRRLKEMAEKSKKPSAMKEGGRSAKKTPLKQFNDWLQRKWFLKSPSEEEKRQKKKILRYYL